MRVRVMSAVTAAMIVAVVVAAGCGSDDITAPPPVVYTATLNAANEKQANPVNSAATGFATLTLRSNDSLDYVVTATNLTAAASASHIHSGVPAVSGNVVFPFVVNSGVTSGTVTSGTLVLSKLVAGGTLISGDSLRVLLNNGNGYVNVHTSTYPQGEIRGQIAKQ
jgi:hypothetical protein